MNTHDNRYATNTNQIACKVEGNLPNNQRSFIDVIICREEKKRPMFLPLTGQLLVLAAS
jgi:hypothetical protein